MLSIASFGFFFAEPRYSFHVDEQDLPYFGIFIVFAAIFAWFAASRPRMENDLRRARDELEAEVAKRTEQTSLLELTHDAIFVRVMDDVITYWNRGTRELFGWTAEQALGKSAHDLLQTVFPMLLERPSTISASRGSSSR